MAHIHEDPVVHDVVREREVVAGDPAGISAGVLLAIAALLAIIVIGLAVLWTSPWDNGGGSTGPVDPGTSDNSGGSNAPSQPQDGGGTGSQDGGGTGGGEAPAQP